MDVKVWSELQLETRFEYGYATHHNSGRRYEGEKVHKIVSEYIVGVTSEYVDRPETIGHTFIVTGLPQLFSSRPLCGCTQGQHAAQPVKSFEADSFITCKKCLKASNLKLP